MLWLDNQLEIDLVVSWSLIMVTRALMNHYGDGCRQGHSHMEAYFVSLQLRPVDMITSVIQLFIYKCGKIPKLGGQT